MIRNNLAQYDDFAEDWWPETGRFQAFYRFNAGRFDYFDRFVGRWAGLEVLDLGCGGGYTSEQLARRGAKVSGVDRSPNSIRVAARHAAEGGLNIVYQQGEAERIPFDANRFDIVVCAELLQHVPDLQVVVSEVARVLKPGGLFLFDTLNRTWISRLVMIWWLESISKKIPHGTHDWHRFIQPAELERCLVHSGFVGMHFQGLSHAARPDASGQLKAVARPSMAVAYIGKAVKSQGQAMT